MSAAVDIQGAEEALRALTAVAAGGWLDAPTEAAADAVIPVARGYPPPPPGSRYDRTYDLRDGWAIAERQFSPTAARVVIGNPVDYSPDVVGDADQAGVHAGRWPTESEILTLAAADAFGAFADEVDAYLTREGL